jgi:hypothetical protein
MRILKCLKWLGFAFVVLATLLFLVVAFENYRGKRAWLAYKAEMEAKGERLDIESQRPPPVPDEQNFAMTPLLAPLLDYQFDPKTKQVQWRDTNASERPKNLFGWRRHAEFRSAGWRGGEFFDLVGCQQELRAQTNSRDPQIQALRATPPGRPAADLLFLLGLNAAELDEIRTASKWPGCSFKVHLDEGFHALLPQLAVMKNFAGAFETKALAELAAGNPDAAFADAQAALAMSDALRTEPLLISCLVRIANLEIALQPLWEGLARQQWTAAQIEQFQSRLHRVNLVEEMQRSLRGERAFSIATLDAMKQDRKEMLETGEGGLQAGALRYMPSGWFYQNELNIARMFQESLQAFDPARRTVDLTLANQTTGAFDMRLRGKHPYTLFASMLFPAINKTVAKTARSQATLSLAVTACALERYRMDSGKYPEAIENLVPRFIDKLPLDPVNGEALHYRRQSDGRFLLYAVGLNRREDDGSVPRDKKGRVQQDQAEGDWVWQYPATTAR